MPATFLASASAAATPSVASAADIVPEHVSAEIAALFDEAVARHRTAGVTWALIGGHGHSRAVLAHGAAGHRELAEGHPAPGSAPMDRGTISRIASMTKSFTAATVLALRDEGRLRLDDPVAQYVPEADGAFETGPDDPEVTVGHLLTMSAGLVTDNPWGDRQEALTREEFAEILRAGLGHVHRPGTGFEYSNTGYALLGRVIDEVTGSDYTTEIRRRFLDPLGLADTAFEAASIDTGRLATGHRVGDRSDATRFEPVPLDSPGVYGAMAGLFSTVDDVATWVRFLAAADAPGEATPAGEPAAPPLSAASRREMQQLQRHQPLAPLPAGEDGRSPGFDRVRGYGLGLVVEQFPDLGEVISHSGGYPGYGSFMVWHRASGVGVVALANSKYAPATPLSMQALRLLQRELPELLAPPRKTASRQTLRAAAAAVDWLRTGDPAAADAADTKETEHTADIWFAGNMDLDSTRAERRRRLEAALAAAGLDHSALELLRPDNATVLSRAQLRWTLRGAYDGAPSVRIDLLTDPRREALVQSLDVTTVAAG
ncbi:serine hydrolase domain-containing protein [Brachybacterium sp. GCM10030268]|uniref:serine hydrolase domain-containing protein n=1 Tax=Brachybacterium sp. GCM10030268 TaxID=3273382 RepID=UPI0036079CA9